MSRRYLLIAADWRAAIGVRVAANRLAALDPDARRTIVAIDADERSLDLLEGSGTVLTGADLGMPIDEVGQWAGAYGGGGVLWVALPHIFRAVGEPGEQVLWLSGDLDVVSAPTAIWDALADAEVVGGLASPSLAPHDHDRPDAANGQPRSLQPVTAVVDQGGELVARSLLGWHVGSAVLEAVLAQWPVPRDHPTHENLACIPVAQHWFNALALASGVAIVAASSLVLSTAQLLAREVTEGTDPETPLVDGEPLSLLVLRNFDPDQPHLLESQVRTARVSERPALAPVLKVRAAALQAAGWPGGPYNASRTSRWETLPEGLPLSYTVRDLIRAGMRAGAITASPYSPEGFDQLRDYAKAPARSGGSIGVNRLLAAIHASRPDLHAAYPALDGPDGLGFLGWVWVWGRDEMSLPESFLPPRPAFLDAAPPTLDHRASEPDTVGVNLAGYFTSELGLGESARQIASALNAAGVATTPVQGLLVPPTRQQADFAPVGPQDAHHDVNVVVVNGDQMPFFARDVGDGFFEDRPTVGVWWWEVDPFPVDEWREALQWIDEVWVGTDFIRGLIEPHVDVPVWVFPVPVSVSQLDVPLDRAHFGFSDDETVFLYVWDYHSTEARKNPSGLVEAYKKAFPKGSGTRLVLKCINHENLPEADEKVRLAAAGRDDITFIDRFLSGREKNGLLELCDCYVSPHRSEGFGYTPAEAMLLGKPVVVTAYGGTTEYTDDTVARMVKWTPARVGPGALPYPPDGQWADPDLDDLAGALRWIVAEPEAVAAMAARGKQRVESAHDIGTSGRAMRDRLDLVRSRGVRRAEPASAPPPPPPVAPLNPTAKSIVKRGLRSIPLAQQARGVWWRMQDRSVAARTAGLRGELDGVRDEIGGLRASFDERVGQQIVEAQAVDRRDRDEIFDQLARDRDATTAGFTERLDALEERILDGVRQRHAHEALHSVEPYGVREAGFAIETVDGIGKALGGTDLAGTGDQYADFLAVFRGPYERVLDLMRPYGHILAGQGPLLDIGCGRGELLEVAEQAGIDARGIDLDVELIAQATRRGRTAVVGDGIAALRDESADTLGSVSAIHVVEHLPVEDLEALFKESLRALRSDGILLVETINPHEVSAASTFWVDPTHRGPVFPEVALALALSTGFKSAHVYAPDGTGDWEHDRTRSTRYALLARR
jgi:glycosyltransferase involved in cell wall biosynthesis/2-polyprenyl-3-methyl-5-hydroxy-6-metoxy-1,4-benzoquinol methylase